MTFSGKVRNAAFLAIIFCAGIPAVYAETFTGKIESILVLKNGQSEVVLSKGKERETIVLNSETTVGSVITADKLKPGATIYLPSMKGGSGGGGGYKGMKSPFQGIPKKMQKKLGLPNFPEIPGVPGRPSEIANLPQIPKSPEIPKGVKLPKVPRVSGNKLEGLGEPAPAAENANRSRPPAPLPVQEPTEEEKTLFGQVSSDKPLLHSSGESSAPEVQDRGRKVLSVKVTDQGVQMELESAGGGKEKVTYLANRSVVQAFPTEGLRKNMRVKAETMTADELKIAHKITVVSQETSR